MKRYIFCFLIILVCSGLFAEVSAVFKEVSGKVEVNDGQKGWVAAKVGMAVSKGSMISTGFKAKATIALGDSLVLVKQLTRMRLNELMEKEGTVSTELYLDVGKVTAEVNISKGKKNDFKLRSPISTAAVRGTTIEFSQDSVILIDGSAFTYNELGRRTHVNAGGGISFDTRWSNPSVEDFNFKDFKVDPFTRDRGGATKGKIVKGLSVVIISLEWQ